MEAWYENPANIVAIGFVIFVALAVRFLLPMILKGLDGRASKIQEQLEQAKKIRAEAEELLESYKRKQKAMLAESEKMLEDAKVEVDRMKIRAEEELKASITRRTEQANEKIARMEKDAVNQVREHIVEVAISATRLLVADELKSGKEDPTIGRALEQIQKLH
jgi:F-type H+-transporting ATPase subunit b